MPIENFIAIWELKNILSIYDEIKPRFTFLLLSCNKLLF